MQAKIVDNKIVLESKYEERHKCKDLGARWSAPNKHWWLENTELNKLKLSEAGMFVDGNRIIRDDDIVFHDSGLIKTAPFNHQRVMTQFLIQHKQAFLLADPGVGKSKGAIDAICLLGVSKTLVICPATIMSNFQKEIQTHSTLTSTIIYGDIKERRELLKSPTDIHIINYDMVEKLKKELIDNGYDMGIVDEAHYLKSHVSKRSKAVYDVFQSIPIRVGMTGTMISNSYLDCFMPFKIVCPSVFGQYITKFKDRYINYGGYGNHEIVGYRHKDELNMLIKSRSISYKLDDVVDLPPEIENVVLVDLSDKTKAEYKRLKKEMVYEVNNNIIVPSNALTKVLRLSQISSGFKSDGDTIEDISDEKLNILLDMIEQIEGKVIVFVRFTHSIDRIMDALSKRDISAYRYDGETKDKSLYLKYNSDNTRVWVAQLQTGLGYSIPVAKQAIFYELDYSFVNKVQNKGRNRRVSGSETGSCVYTYLLGKGTIDEAIYKCLEKKDATAQDVMNFIREGD